MHTKAYKLCSIHKHFAVSGDEVFQETEAFVSWGMPTKDTLWKGALEDFFPEMMMFFYPEDYLKIEYGSVEFLDKE